MPVKPKRKIRWIKWTALTLLSLAVLGAAGLGIAYYHFSRDLPDVAGLRDVRFQVPLRVYTREGDLIGTFGEQRRRPLALEVMPQSLIQAFLAGEDARFYEHPGVDWQGISRAAINLIRTGDRSIGGSTITQQLARNLFLGSEKTYVRKAREALLSLRIEEALDKDEILELYLNKIFLGNRAYGVGAAAEVYYGKTPGQLTLAESAMIAALPKAPSRINPIDQPERALERRNYVLGRMLELGMIDAETHQTAVAAPDRAYYHGPILAINAPYVAELARAEMVQRFGQEAYEAGLRVFTTISSPLQQAANEAVRQGLLAYDLRHGYRGPEAQVELPAEPQPADWRSALEGFETVAGLEPGVVTEVSEDLALVLLTDGQTIALDLPAMAWAKPFIDRNRTGAAPESVDAVVASGDVIRLARTEDGGWRLAQLPEAQSAFIAMDPDDGAIEALVGGLDFAHSKFNRATQGQRQPGSSFKPFVYSAALARGFTTASIINDAPVVFRNSAQERSWKPQNSSREFYGPTRLREAMVNSRNLVSIRLLEDIGLSFARDYISDFGFDKEALPRDLSMALGSATLSPLSIAEGYAVFANGGYRVESYLIGSVRNVDGEVVYEANPTVVCEVCSDYPEVTEQPVVRRPPEIDGGSRSADDEPAPVRPLGPPVPRIAKPVISPQNAYLVRSMMMDVIKRGTGSKAMGLGRDDLAGKTGTTNDQRDAWFSGFHPDLVATAWVGFDDFSPLGRLEFGAQAALPIWMHFMEQALADRPTYSGQLPDGLATVRINPETGRLAAIDNPNAIMEVFEAGNLPPLEQVSSRLEEEPPQENPYEVF